MAALAQNKKSKISESNEPDWLAIAAKHADATLANAMCPEPSSLHTLIPSSDWIPNTFLLNLPDPAPRFAWFSLLREQSEILEFGDSWPDNMASKHYPILLQDPVERKKAIILEGFEALFKYYGLSPHDAEICHRKNPVVLKINLETKKGRALYYEIREAKSDFDVAFVNARLETSLLEGGCHYSFRAITSELSINSFFARHNIGLSARFLWQDETIAFKKENFALNLNGRVVALVDGTPHAHKAFNDVLLTYRRHIINQVGRFEIPPKQLLASTASTGK